MTQYLLVLLAALLVSAIGFEHYVHFFSVGYGFSIAAIGLVLIISLAEGLGAVTVLMGLVLVIYGLRLGMYLMKREKNSTAYNERVMDSVKDTESMKFSSKFLMWISCAFLYSLMVSPLLFRLLNGEGAKNDEASIIGLVFMILGFAMEAIADHQKTKAKEEAPDTFVSKGLYRIVRCPNYLGELILWTGMLLSGIGGVHGYQWIPAFLGWIGIVYVMFSGAKRLEERQNRTYGEDPAYEIYVSTVPILLPFTSIFSLEKYDFLKA